MSVTRTSTPAKRRFESMSVRAGVLAGSTYPHDQYKNNETREMIDDPRGGMPTAVIAAALEYGTGQRLARPFIHLTAAQSGKAWARDLRKLVKTGVPLADAFKTVGQIMKEDIQHMISTWPADNSDEWAAVKGFSHGLIFTSHLLKSIESEVSGD